MKDSNDNPFHGQAIALAGMYQAARLVQQTARGQVRDTSATQTSVASLFITSPGTAEDVYDGSAGLAIGLEVLCQQLGSNGSARDLELTGYVVALMHLERKLSRQPALLDEISRGIESCGDGGVHGPAITPEIISMLADIYTRTVSTLTPRIMVKGEPGILTGTDSQNMIRALLLAGIRAAVLWRQCGGSRIKLVFRRKTLLEHARRLSRGMSGAH